MKKYFKQMGPAWMAIALNIGGATAANAGALASATGFTYLWSLLPTVFVIWMICMLMTRTTLKSGLGPVGLARKELGNWAAWMTAISVFIVNTVFHAIQYAIVGNIMTTLFGVPATMGAVLGFVFVMAVVLLPSGDKAIKLVQNILQVMVWVLLASFAIVLFTVEIPWGDVFGGFVPTLTGDSGEMVRLAGLMGACIAINVPTLGAYGAAQNKWDMSRKGLSTFELTFTNAMLWLVQVVVIIACATVLYPAGVLVTSAATMAETFAPFSGSFGTTLMCIGLLGSVLSSMASQLLVSGYVLSDLLGWEIDLSSKKFKISEIILTLFGLSAPVLGWNAFSISSYGSGFNLTFFPIVSILFVMIYKKIFGKEASQGIIIGSIVAIVLSLVATANYWVALLG